MGNQLTRMARQLLSIEEDLPFRFDYSVDRATIDDFELHTFEQVWGSTTLGFGGIGGQACTQARTYVFVPITCGQKCFVYFGSRFAYTADCCEKLTEDIHKQNMEPVIGAGKYKREED